MGVKGMIMAFLFEAFSCLMILVGLDNCDTWVLLSKLEMRMILWFLNLKSPVFISM